MEIKDMMTEDIEKRSAEIEKEIAEGGDVEALTAEVEALEERKAQIEKEAEERKALIDAVEMTSTEVEERKEETMDIKELRNSNEYINAFANFVKTGSDKECRTLMTQYGTVTDSAVLPVPEFVADIVAEAFKRSEIVAGFRKMNAKGIVKVPVEINAPAADLHKEGEEAIEEEALTLKNVMLKPFTYKKWVSISDEALDVEVMGARSYLEYIYDEIARGIEKARENLFIGALNMNVDQLVITETWSGTAQASDFVNARAKLNPEAARDAVIITTPTVLAQYKALLLNANYPIDIFDGMKVLTTTADLDGFIVGDLRGYMENLPKGEEIEFKKDDTSLMTSDIVRILGRMPAAVGVVGKNYFVVNKQQNA